VTQTFARAALPRTYKHAFCFLSSNHEVLRAAVPCFFLATVVASSFVLAAFVPANVHIAPRFFLRIRSDTVA
jgi:hypothetical protein